MNINLNNRVKIKLNNVGMHILNAYYKKNKIDEWDKNEIQMGYYKGQFTTLMKIFRKFFIVSQASDVLPFENLDITMYDDHNWELDETGKILPIKEYNFSLLDHVKVQIKPEIIFDLYKRDIYFKINTEINLLQLLKIFSQYVTPTRFPLESSCVELITDLDLEESEDFTRKGV